MKRFLLLLLIIVFVYGFTIEETTRLSFKTLLSNADQLNNKYVTLMGVVESVDEKQVSTGTIYEFEIYTGVTVIVEPTIINKKIAIKKGDLIEVYGTFFVETQQYHTQYHNLIVCSRIKRLVAA